MLARTIFVSVSLIDWEEAVKAKKLIHRYKRWRMRNGQLQKLPKNYIFY